MGFSSAGARRWWPAGSLIFAIAVYGAVEGGLEPSAAQLLTDVAWAIGSLLAALACLAASRDLAGRGRAAWALIGLGVACWFTGHVIWASYNLRFGRPPQELYWIRIVLLGYPIFVTAGLLTLPRPTDTAFSFRHVSNLALIACTAIVALIVALLEPALRLFAGQPAFTALIVIQSLALAVMFMTALYLLWSYRWGREHWPLSLLALATGIHAVAYIVFAHRILTGPVRLGDGYDIAWLTVFALATCAAFEQRWQTRHPQAQPRTFLLPRERWLEGLIPAALLMMMLIVIVLNDDLLTPRVVAFAVAASLVFILVSGIRDLWIQRHEQSLLTLLRESNADMLEVNRELAQSEANYRALNEALEQRVSERTRELQTAYRELENFSYAVAHDLKAPLRAVSGFGELLAEKYDSVLDQEGRNYIRRMQSGAHRMSDLIDGLLAYAQVERRPLQMTRVSLPQLIDQAIDEQHDEIERCRAAMSVTVAPIEVMADSDGLLLACRNLLQNALKFSRHAQSPQVAITVETRGREVEITISDNGVGFDMTYHEQIFDMFQRLHRANEFPGTGIGLAIVRKAVERMGGRVWAVAAPGAGAKFFVTLPLQAQREVA